MLIHIVNPFTGRRLRARRVDEDRIIASIAERAIRTDDWQFEVHHGGNVANSYGYPAETECVLVVSDPFGIVVLWAGRASANKVTERGAAEACLSGSGDLFDQRIGSERRKDTRELLMQKHRFVVPEMEVIAIAAS